MTASRTAMIDRSTGTASRPAWASAWPCTPASGEGGTWPRIGGTRRGRSTLHRAARRPAFSPERPVFCFPPLQTGAGRWPEVQHACPAHPAHPPPRRCRSVTTGGRVPILSWATPLEGSALEQARNLANLPFAIDHVALMPDAHTGYGMPIGGVLFADKAVVPYAIGVDIGCGVALVETDLTVDDARPCHPGPAPRGDRQPRAHGHVGPVAPGRP